MAYIASDPAGPFICMGVIVVIVLGVKAILKIKKNGEEDSDGTGENDGE